MAIHNLRACPFCGGRPYIESRFRAFIKAETTKVAFVRCKDCHARTDRFPLSMGQANAVQAAVNRWNCRWNDSVYYPTDDHR